MADKKINGSLEIAGKLNPNSSGYGISIPDTSSLTADKTLGTADQIDLKADKVGPLPNYGDLNGVNILDFLTENDLANKFFVFKYQSIAFITCFYKLTTKVYSFEIITFYYNGQRYVGDMINLQGLKFNDVISNEYLKNYEVLSNKVTSLSSSSTDAQYPSAKCVYDFVEDEPNLIETTWSNLKSLRDSSQLIPGRFYRITDYECTTAQEDTSSAGHQFDIIVTADSENTLNENARAADHMAGSSLYHFRTAPISFGNGSTAQFTRDSTADFTDNNGARWYAFVGTNQSETGYVYVQDLVYPDSWPTGENVYCLYCTGEGSWSYKSHAEAEATGDDYNIRSISSQEAGASVYDVSYDTYFVKANLATWELKYSLDNNNYLYPWAVTRSIVINSKRYYRNVASTPNLSKAAPYSWKATDSTASPSVVYTAYDFMWTGGSAYSSQEATGTPYNITAMYDEGKGVIYWMKDDNSNEAPYDFKNILFTKSGSYTNVYTFTKYISDGLIDGSLAPAYTNNSSCSNNKIIQDISWGLPFVVFLFPSSSHQYQWNDNIIEDSRQITLNYRCHYNQIYHSRNITIGGESSRNYIYSSNNLTLGTSCSQNSFDSVCSYITLSNYCSNNSFDNGCDHINLNSNYCYYNKFGNRCTYINLQSNTSGANDNRLQYVVVHDTVQGTSSEYKTITVDRNLAYETNIVPAGTVYMEV